MTVMVASPTETQIFTALRAYILGIFGLEFEVIRGQINYVPSPEGDAVVMWPNGFTRLATNESEYDPVENQRNVTTPMQWTIQLDVHGETSADNAATLSSLFRDFHAVEFFKTNHPGVTPLSADEPRQVPFVNGEKTFENRWTFYLQMEVNTIISAAQQFADELDPNIIEVDITYGQ